MLTNKCKVQILNFGLALYKVNVVTTINSYFPDAILLNIQQMLKKKSLHRIIIDGDIITDYNLFLGRWRFKTLPLQNSIFYF